MPGSVLILSDYRPDLEPLIAAAARDGIRVETLKTGRWFTAILDGRPVGFAAMTGVGTKTVRFRSLWVEPEFRRHGVGGWLVEQRMKVARSLGSTFARACIAAGTVPPPYADLGFRPVRPYAAGLLIEATL